MRVFVVVVLVGSLAGCLENSPYHCTNDSQCAVGDAPGRCELGPDLQAYCAVLDDSCPAWTRFGTAAGPYAGQCTGNALPADRGGDLCLEGARFPYDYAGCTHAVCDASPSCCAAAWTSECVRLAATYCGLPCYQRAVVTGHDQFVAVSDDDRDGTFELHEQGGMKGQKYHGVRFADLDGDVDPEIAIGTADFITSGRDQGIYHFADGAPVLALDLLTVTDGNQPLVQSFLGVSIAVGDYDADGVADLTWIGYAPGGVTFHGRPGLAFEEGPSYGPPERDAQILSGGWADVDGDGDTDLALGDYNAPAVSIMTADHQTLTQTWRQPTPTSVVWLAWADVDGDKHPDLAVTGDGYIRVYRNQGGQLAATPSLDAGGPTSGARSVGAWIDFDLDGDPDLALAFGDGPLWILRNDGGTFPTTPAFVSVEKHLFTDTLVAGDLDGDGWPDLALASKDQPAGALWFRNRQDGTFVSAELPVPAGEYHGIALGPRRRP